MKKLGSLLWSSVNWVRRQGFKQGVLASDVLGPKVVSIGNLVAGGAGKTPLTIFIAESAIAAGQTVVILTRGYGGALEQDGGVIAPHSNQTHSQTFGDEPVLIHQRVPGAWIGVGKNRVTQFRKVEAMIDQKIDLVLLDDGFQHLQIQRDLDILLVSQSDERQLRREFLHQSNQADLVVFRHEVGGSERPVWFRKIDPSRKAEVRYQIARGEGKKVVLVTAVARPDRVRSLVDASGYEVVDQFLFPDHHLFSESEQKEILKKADEHSASLLLTGKDAVKWTLEVDPDRFCVVEPHLNWVSGKENLENIL